jgi:Fe-Mn family superoxide dismutase
MQYEPKDFSRLIGTAGFSDTILNNHFTLYQGYVTNVNKLSDNLKALVENDKTGTPEYAEMKRRFGWEWNGFRLHEYYFGNMIKGGSSRPTDSVLAKSLTEQFGSIDTWEKDFRATGAMRGIGWTILYSDPQAKRLFNVWVNEHDMGHLAGCKPLLALDVFEHAYVLDYGLKRADYIEAFMASVDWAIVEERFVS